MKADGTIVINDGTDFMVRFSAMEIAYLELQAKYNTHKHVLDIPNLEAEITTNLSTGSMTAAKIAEIKVPGVI